MRYDALAKRFIGAPLRAVMWEIAHAFGSIRLRDQAGVHAVMACYWPGKSPLDWKLERLSSEFTVFDTVTALNQEPQPDPEVGTDEQLSIVNPVGATEKSVEPKRGHTACGVFKCREGSCWSPESEVTRCSRRKASELDVAAETRCRSRSWLPARRELPAFRRQGSLSQSAAPRSIPSGLAATGGDPTDRRRNSSRDFRSFPR